jgi:spore coat polysaccharide biosynthesis predicted glycosyltransferase SpsG
VIVRLVFKADATRVTGSGHVMRSCVIAESAIAKGIDTIFIGNIDGINWLKVKIESIGFSQILNNISYYQLDESEDVLVLDSYDTSDSWILNLDWRGKVAVVDPVTPNFQADLRFHPGLEDDWAISNESKFHGSGEFLLVRKELREIVRLNKKNDSLLEILITGGGSDPYNLCGQIAEMITPINSRFSVSIISDQHNIPIKDTRFSIYPTGNSLVKLLPKIDLVFAPASTICLEVLTLGIPLGIVCVVENQDSNYRKLVEEGAALGIGNRNLDNSWDIDFDSLTNLINSKELRSKLAQQSLGRYDSLGSDRIVNKLIEIYS